VPTETVTYSANFNGNTKATIGGTVTAGDVTSLTVYSAGLTGGSKTVSYTAAGGNTLTSIATGLRNAINADTNLAAIGVTATSSAAVVTIATAGTTYTTSTSGGATVTLTQGTNANGNSTVAVGGRVTAENTATITTFNPTLPGGQQAVTFNIGASDTLVSIAAGLANAMNGNANLQTLGVTAKNSDAADLTFSQSFSGNGTVPSNASLANVSATDAVPTTKTNTNALTVTASASSTLTWDANGNMTSDGTNTYKWDAENRLIQIDYQGSGNKSVLTISPLGARAKFQEYSGGSVTSTKQFWGMEERDGSGSIAKQFFRRGEIISGFPYFYSLDHLGSVRELTDFSGNKQAVYRFDPYGVKSTMLENVAADFQFAGYYFHSSSGLSLTNTRAYNSSSGRFINRDPIEESGGINLYGYVANMPVGMTDPTGLDPVCKNPCPPNWTGHVLVAVIAGYSIWVQCYKGQQTGNGTVSGNGGSRGFSYNIGNGPMGPGAQAASALLNDQYYNHQLTVLAIMAAVNGGLLAIDAASAYIAKQLSDVEKLLKPEWGSPEHTGGIENGMRDYWDAARKILDSLWYKG
jgi:RHS repeat-associated protein